MRSILLTVLGSSLLLANPLEAATNACTFPTGSGVENLSSKILTGYYGWDSSGNILQGSLANHGAFNAATTSLTTAGYITSIEGLSLSQVCSTAQLFGQAGTADCSSSPVISITGSLSWGATTESSKTITLSVASSGTSVARLTFTGAGSGSFRVESIAGVTLNTLASAIGTQFIALDSVAQPSKTMRIKALYSAGSEKTMTLSVTDSSGNTQSKSVDATISGPSTTNMVLWLKADAGVTYDGSNRISSWTDQSGQGHDATQSTTDEKPLYVSNAVNSQPGIRFDGSNDYLTVSGTFAIAQVFVVFKSMTSTFNTYGAILGVSGGGDRLFAFEIGQTYFHWNPFPTAVWKNGTSLSSPFNLTTLTNYMSLTVNTYASAVTQAFYIARLQSGAYFGNFEIAEIIGYSSENSAETRQNIESYLASKYGL